MTEEELVKRDVTLGELLDMIENETIKKSIERRIHELEDGIRKRDDWLENCHYKIRQLERGIIKMATFMGDTYQ